MKKYFILFFAILGIIQVGAQNMREIWINMPDSIIPYINKSQRTELADYVNMSMKAEVQNKLSDTTRIEKLTDNYILVHLNNVSRLEIKLLDNSHIAMVQTWNAPVAESKLSLFSKNWESKTLNLNTNAIFEKPDSMSQKRYGEILELTKDIMCEMKLSAADNNLMLIYSDPLLSNAEKKDLTAIIKQRKLKWNGIDFN